MVRARLAVLVGFVACACGQTAAAPPPSTPVAAPAPAPDPARPAAPEPAPAAPEKAFRDRTRAEREEYMDRVVVPKMEAVFAAHDAKRYAGFGCETCHGKGATDGTFVMPNPDLPIVPREPAAFEALAQAHPDAVRWMSERVVPAMAALLQRDPFDPKDPKPDAVGCGTCHSAGH